MANNPEGPQRPPSHVIGDTALNRFNAVRRQEWIVYESSRNDYGWDLLIGLTRHEIVMPDDFFVQIKGSNSLDYIRKNQLVSFPLETATVKWLLSKPQPSMLAVCDSSRPEQPVYWVWLNDVVPSIRQWQGKLLTQTTVSIHIPVEAVLTPSAWDAIEDYVINFNSERKICETIGGCILPALGSATIDDSSQYRNSPISFLTEHMGPLVRAGVFEAGEMGENEAVKTLTPEDQKRFQGLREVQTAVEELRD